MALWYVDNSVGSSGAGTSWGAAWKDFNNIVWSSVAAGDTIYISGGTTSQTYSSVTLTIGKSGTAGNLITIDSGINAPVSKPGTVIIDGLTSMTFAAGGAIVDNGGFTYLVIQNLTLQNTFENCLWVHAVSSGTVLVQNIIAHTGTGRITAATNATTAATNGILHFAVVPTGVAINAAVADQSFPTSIPSPSYVTATGAGTVTIAPVNTALINSGDTIQFAFNARAFRITANTGGTITLQNCTADDPSNTIAQTDSVYTDTNSGTSVIIIQNNTLTVNNIDPSGHSDTYQSGHDDVNITFRNNFLIHPNGGINNHGIIVDTVANGGVVYCYNNIIVMGQIPGNTAGQPQDAILREVNAGVGTGSFKCWNNTVYGGYYGLHLWLPSATPIGDEYKNNIIYSPPQGVVPYFLDGAAAAAYAPSAFDYNLIFAPNSTNLQAFSVVTAVGLVRSTTSQSSGLLYAEIQIGYINAGNSTLFGLVNATESTGNWIGQTANSVGYFYSDGKIYTNNASLLTTFLSVPGDVVAIAIDETNKKIWFKNLNANTGWNNAAIGSQNPVGNVGGASISTVTGAHFLAQSFNSAGTYSILNTGATPFVGTMPTGYSAWGSAATWDSGHMSANLSLAQPLANNNGTLQTFAAWQAAGYDAHGVNADPKFGGGVLGSAVATAYQITAGSPAIDAGVPR